MSHRNQISNYQFESCTRFKFKFKTEKSSCSLLSYNYFSALYATCVISNQHIHFQERTIEKSSGSFIPRRNAAYPFAKSAFHEGVKCWHQRQELDFLDRLTFSGMSLEPEPRSLMKRQYETNHKNHTRRGLILTQDEIENSRFL